MKITATKLGATVALLAFLGISAVGCSSPESTGSSSNEGTKPETEQVEEAPEPVSLEGVWKQNNSNSEDSWQQATITGDTIEVYWVADAGDTKSLYWAGTVEVPAEGDSFSFDSANDTSKTEKSIMASGDATKTFTFENDELSYEVTAMGTTMTVRLSHE
ncbi:hypothetical protein [Microbacterium sp.]|uniref:hypothetical protein n=1 Tax=Microbacterium sp. TaxID=51671 RepID=UPI002734EE4D|nr:hypothetical protein [Microbacterium sp.]MDP3952982.1 hypothetical protein [Microbacterium sp.]